MKLSFRLLSFFLTVNFILLLCGCQTQKNNSHRNELHIVTSFYPIYSITKEVSGDLNDVRMIQSGAGIHSFEPSPTDIQAIYDADVFIYHSHTLESWAGKLDPNLEHSKVKVIEASVGMDLQRVTGLEDVEVTDGVDEATLYDPHTWLDPLLVAQEAHLIADQLASIDQKHAATYKENAEKFSKKAEELASKYEKSFAKTTSKVFVTQHTAFAYLAKRFNLTQLGIASVSNEEPSPRQLAEIKEFVETYHVHTIFAERGVSQKVAQTLANSTGVELKELDPLEADPQNNRSYLENLETNLNTLEMELSN